MWKNAGSKCFWQKTKSWFGKDTDHNISTRSFTLLRGGVGIVWLTTTRTWISDATAVTFSVKCFNSLKHYPDRKHLQKVVCFIFLFRSIVFNGKSDCCNNTFTDFYIAASKEYLRRLQIIFMLLNQHFISYFAWNCHSNWLLFLRVARKQEWLFFFWTSMHVQTFHRKKTTVDPF